MSLQISQALFLFFVAGIAGILNALAGGGSFLSFPALLFTGVPPVRANATNTVALWPGLAASSLAYLKRLDVPRLFLGRSRCLRPAWPEVGWGRCCC